MQGKVVTWSLYVITYIIQIYPLFFFYKGILFIGVKKIVLSMKENMRVHELSVLAKKDIQCIWREKPSKDLVWKLFPLVGRCPYSVTGFGERRNLGFMVKAHAAVWGNQGLLSGPKNSAPIGLIAGRCLGRCRT